jgi:hypothetical protein
MAVINDYEAKILSFIKMNKKATLIDIENAFPDIESIDLRIRGLGRTANRAALITPETVECNEACQTIYKHTGFYLLSQAGSQALQDYEHEKGIETKRFLRNSVVVPILVTTSTTLLLALLQALLQRIQELLRHTP